MRARACWRQLAAAFVGVGLGVAATASSALAAERAYELVTPPGSDPKVLVGAGEATPDGNTVCFASERVLPGSETNGIVTADDGYCSRRTPSGWETRWVTGPAVTEQRGAQGAQPYFVSPDGARVAFASDAGIYPDWEGDWPASTPGTVSAFMWEGGRMPRWLSPAPEPLPDIFRPVTEQKVQRQPLAVSDDLSHGVFTSMLRLVPEDTNADLDVYEWTPNGTRLVSRDESGVAVGGNSPFGRDDQSNLAQRGTMSRDGSRIFFQHTGSALAGAPAGVQSVFLREGDELRHVSPRRGPDVAQDVYFAGASANGEIVYLWTAEQLTNDPKDPTDALYRYDLSRDELTLVATHPSGISFLDVSADGSTVVYRTGGFPPELFVQRSGTVTSLGALDFTDTIGIIGQAGSTRVDKRALRLSADGRRLAFASRGAFAGTPGGVTQVFSWSSEGGVRHVSAKSDGSLPSSAATIGNFSTQLIDEPRGQQIIHNMRNFPNLGRVLTDDGRIFFETMERLNSFDVNSYVDVYEWNDGVVRLITPGTQEEHAFYHDNSADGNTVFFTTDARVIPELDRNTSPDLYAARVGGGFPLPPAPDPCEGDACQGAAPVPPAPPQRPGSTTFGGPGDRHDPAPVAARFSVMRVSAAQRRAFARRGRTVLRVRASENGVVSATARARIARRNVVVARAAGAARRGATLRLRLSLSSRARRALRAGRRLRVVISVSYSETDTTIRRVVVLRG